MNQITPFAVPPQIPENAPFSSEQRAWLNGFIAGLLQSSGGTGQALAPPLQLGEAPSGPADPLDDGDDGEAPWHDQTLPMPERMELAEGRPLRRRMMAAMGQQDCGQCGYSCEDYANAIFLREEDKLNLCAPGGKATTRMLKTLFTEMDSEAPQTKDASPAAAPAGPGRDSPVAARVLGVTRLNGEGSAKETNHVDLEVAPGLLPYEAGDSLGIYASNDPALAEALLAYLKADPETEVVLEGAARKLREALISGVSLSPAPDELFELLAGLSQDQAARGKLLAMAAGEDPDGDLETLDVLAALEKFPELRPAPAELIGVLEPLQPRLYSISSSPKTVPDRVSITVDAVRYCIDGRQRKGVASCFLAERVAAGDQVSVYIQKAKHFALPADAATPIVMIGPGTGIAPFRAFLQERQARQGAGQAPGPAWLFFGHQHEASDFFYREELEGFLAAGTLSRLTTAWSRDGAEKVYVQHRLRAEGAELYRWLTEGAHVYICGDGARMAVDVEAALRDLVAEHGGMEPAAAATFIAELGKSGRYQKDVY